MQEGVKEWFKNQKLGLHRSETGLFYLSGVQNVLGAGDMKGDEYFVQLYKTGKGENRAQNLLGSRTSPPLKGNQEP